MTELYAGNNRKGSFSGEMPTDFVSQRAGGAQMSNLHLRMSCVVMLSISLVGCIGDTIDDPSPEAQTEAGLAIAERVFAAPDVSAELANLNASDRQKFDAVTTPGSLEVTELEIPEQSSSYVGCYGWHQTYLRKALAGNTLYTYWQSTFVCVNGSVTSVWLDDVGGETSTPGWRIDRDPTTSTKNVGWEGRGNARYYFVLGAGGVDIQHPVDCIQQRLNANGRDHRSMSSCDLAAP